MADDDLPQRLEEVPGVTPEFMAGLEVWPPDVAAMLLEDARAGLKARRERPWGDVWYGDVSDEEFEAAIRDRVSVAEAAAIRNERTGGRPGELSPRSVMPATHAAGGLTGQCLSIRRLVTSSAEQRHNDSGKKSTSGPRRCPESAKSPGARVTRLEEIRADSSRRARQ